MSRYRITKSLIEEWAYCFNCYEDNAESAYRRFLAYLRREPSVTTEAMQDGLDFEADVYAMVNGFPKSQDTPEWWERGERLVADELVGAEIQVRVERDMTCCGMELHVVGVLDGLKAGVIKDVKKVSSGFASDPVQGKYLSCSQHPCYFYLVPEAHRFDYLVSDGEDLYIESYTPKNSRPFPDIVTEFIVSITEMGLLDEYKKYWIEMED